MWEDNRIEYGPAVRACRIFCPKNEQRAKAETVEDDIVWYNDDRIGTQFYNTLEGLKRASENGYDRFTNIEKTERFLSGAKHARLQGEQEFKNFLHGQWKKYSNRQLYDYFIHTEKLFQQIYAYFLTSEPQYFSQIEQNIRKKLSVKMPPEMIDDAFIKLTHPEEIDPLTKEKLEWLNTVRLAKKQNYPKSSTEMKKKIRNHANKYFYVGLIDADIIWDFDYYMKKMTRDIATDADKQIEQIKRRAEAIRKEKNNLKQKLDIDPKILAMTDNAGKISAERLRLRLGWTQAAYMQFAIISEMAERLNNSCITESVLLNQSSEEIEDTFLRNRQINADIIKQRQETYLIHVTNGTVKSYFGDKAKKIKRDFTKNIDTTEKNDELSGTIACKGLVRGRVEIFSWADPNIKEKMERMNPGTILVAGQTRPFLMPAVRKAAAIITDEGGITCHAAIVARELNIPCIIGTHNATKHLRDGDEIEVDANTGRIHNIKKMTKS